jgi:hypothetical protein
VFPLAGLDTYTPPSMVYSVRTSSVNSAPARLGTQVQPSEIGTTGYFNHVHPGQLNIVGDAYVSIEYSAEFSHSQARFHLIYPLQHFPLPPHQPMIGRTLRQHSCPVNRSRLCSK